MDTVRILELHSHGGVVSYRVCICVASRYISFSSMSEAGVRTWLARQGIPFVSQPELTTVKGG